MTTEVPDYDVLVVGTGAAGSAAAIVAHDAGARVLMIEKMPADQAGGNTRVTGGLWFDNRDAARAATFLRSLSGERPLPDDVVEAWATETAHNTAWIDSLGGDPQLNQDVPVDPEYPELEGSDCYGGSFGVGGVMGHGRLHALLQDALAERAVEIRYETPGRRLVTDGTGAVVGVEAEHAGETMRFGARGGVVLATGGFQADPVMVRDYLHTVDPPLWGSPASTGDGHKMAMGVGADLWHMNNHFSTAGISFPGSRHGFTQFFAFAKGFIWVAPDGTRFTNELPHVGHGQALQHGLYQLFPEHYMHTVFDEATRRAGPVAFPRHMGNVGWQMIVNGDNWSNDNLEEVDRGIIKRADSLGELAELLGVEPSVLAATVERWNADCATGADTQYGRPGDSLTPLTEAPFYAISGPPLLGWTNGGPRRDGKAQVIHVSGATVPGLYAAGEISSTYSWSKEGGFHIADALAIGRIAGAEAARRAVRLVTTTLDTSTPGEIT